MNEYDITDPDPLHPKWYWDLKKGVAVPETERGPDSETLGPYATKADAENWKETAEARNSEWEADDEEWNEWGSDDGSDPKSPNS